MAKNVILTGLMGTGKTTVGRLAAGRLGRDFVDMDECIEAQAAKPIARIFAEDGEAAFRQIERTLCLRLAETNDKVISTGGGALIDAECRKEMLDKAIVICLRAEIDELVRRVGENSNDERPLLSAADRHATLHGLWDVRKDVYTQMPWQIDTTNLSVEEVARQVVSVASYQNVKVSPPGETYEILVGNGLLRQAGNIARRWGVPPGSRVMIVSNEVVAPLYAAELKKALEWTGFQTALHIMPDGEQYKTLSSLEDIYTSCLEAGLGRGDTILALGGGVCGDVAGFAAATYMRGVRFIQVPTTLLAMVDSSVGGKTAVDLPQGKNLAGAFKQPAGVIIDPSVLRTLAGREVQAGMAEAIKHALIGDENLFRELEDGSAAKEDWWEGETAVQRILRTLAVKIKIVDEDPFEGGRRALLNCGHTIGHGVESVSGYTLKHGEAVAIGLAAETLLAERCGLAAEGLARRVSALLRRWGLPVRIPAYAADEIWQVLGYDKKKQGRTLRFALPQSVGAALIVDTVPPMLVRQVLSEMGAV